MKNYRVILENSYEDGRKLIYADKLSYAVMYNVLGGAVMKIVTNDCDYIIAHTAKVFPTWIWAPDNCDNDKLEEIYQVFVKEFEPVCEYRINTKYEIAEYFVKRFAEDGYEQFKIMANIAAYECHNPKKPEKSVEGKLKLLSEDEFDITVKLIQDASKAIGDRILSHEESVEAAKEQLQRQVLFVWKNNDGKVVSFCDKNKDDNYVKISQVYTPSEERGKGYAAWMIYELCCDIIKNKQIPMLYADADYISSNRCYQKIGFELKGKIAMIGGKTNGRN